MKPLYLPIAGSNFFKKEVMFFDTNQIIINLLKRKNLKFVISSAFRNPEYKYDAVFITFSRFKIKKFIKIMTNSASVEMLSQGFGDYEDFCLKFIDRIEKKHSENAVKL